MRCPACKNFYYKIRLCPDCVPSLESRKRVSGNLDLNGVADLFRRYGWGAEEYNDDGEATLRLYHEQDLLPPFHLLLYKNGDRKQMDVIVPVCDLTDDEFAHLAQDVHEVANEFNSYRTSFKCFVSGSILVFTQTLSIIAGTSEVDLVYGIECELDTIVELVSQAGVLERDNSADAGEGEGEEAEYCTDDGPFVYFSRYREGKIH